MWLPLTTLSCFPHSKSSQYFVTWGALLTFTCLEMTGEQKCKLLSDNANTWHFANEPCKAYARVRAYS